MVEQAWRIPEGWVLLTEHSPREMGGLVPMAVYFPKVGPTKYQYRVGRKPRSTRGRMLTFLPE